MYEINRANIRQMIDLMVRFADMAGEMSKVVAMLPETISGIIRRGVGEILLMEQKLDNEEMLLDASNTVADSMMPFVPDEYTINDLDEISDDDKKFVQSMLRSILKRTVNGSDE